MPLSLRIYLLGFLTVSSIAASAQPAVFERGLAPQVQYNTGIPVVGRAQKLTAATQLTAQSHYKLKPGTAELTLVDSGSYNYSGNRCGDPLEMLEYDTEVKLSSDGGKRRSIQTYNPDNTVSGYRTQRWDEATASWIDLSRHVLAYSKGSRVSDTSWNWNAAEASWAPGGYSVRQLNDAGLPLGYTRFSWNAERHCFDSLAHSRSIYSPEGYLRGRTVSYGDGRLAPATRTVYSYNERGAAIQVRVFNWDTASKDWFPGSCYVFQLNAADDRVKQTHYEFLSGEGYRELDAYEYQYDERRNVTSMTGSGDRISYSYDQLGQCTGMMRSRTGANAVTEARRYYYASEPASVAKADRSGPIRIWPVPASGSLQLDVRALQGDSYTATINAMDGREVRSLRRPALGSATDRVELGGLPSGVYVLRLQSAGGKQFQSRFTVAN